MPQANSILLILFVLLTHHWVICQVCPQDDYVFRDQAAIDDFALTSQGCSVITGDVRIEEREPGDIRDLAGLAGITAVHGRLTISYNMDLSSLEGLQLLDTVGEIWISSNPNLSNVNGLTGLHVVGGLTLAYNDALISLHGLNELDVLGGSLVISGNALLASLEGLEPPVTDSLHTIEIHHNPQLTVCNNAFICSAQQYPDISFYLFQNAAGCNSFFEVAYGCGSDCPHQLIFENQADIDRFPSLFPSCNAVSGDVRIAERFLDSPIIHLDSLYGIHSIGGDLQIARNSRLGQLQGLSQLDSLGGDLWILDNDSLQHVMGLDGLDRLQHVEITGNTLLQDLQGLHHVKEAQRIALDQIESLHGLDSLQHVSGDFLVKGLKFRSCEGAAVLKSVAGKFEISDADSLTDLTGLEQIARVGSLILRNTGIRNMDGLSGLMEVDSHLTIVHNDGLVSLGGMTPITDIGGSIDISYNESLEDLYPLQGVTKVQGDFLLRSNNTLSDLDELNSLVVIQGSFAITSNTGLKHLNNLSNLQVVGGNLVINNSNLESCEGLENLRKVGGDLRISSGGKLIDLSALVRLDSVYGRMSILGTGLDTLDGLHQLRYVGGTLEIRNNRALLAIPGMDSLRSVGGVWIDENRILQDMDGLRALEELRGILRINYNSRLKRLPLWRGLRTIAGDLIIERSPDLTALTGLDSLVSIKGQLNLYDLGVDSLAGLEHLETCEGGLILRNLGILNVAPLSNLRQVQGPLVIQDNFFLSDIEGFRHLDPESIMAAPDAPDVTIIDNPYLGKCASELLCTLLEASNRKFLIENNSLGCESPFDVQTQCAFPYACLPSGITFSRQSQIDSFKIMYPSCSFIQGDVMIMEDMEGGILSLDSLNTVATVGGDLRISGNQQLMDLNGLGSLTRVGGGLRLSFNPKLVSIDGLKHIDPLVLTMARPQSYDLWMNGNASLSECAIDPVCGVFTNPEAAYVIQGNMPECSHPDSVLSRCSFPIQCELDTITSQSMLNEFPIRYPHCTELTGDLVIWSTLLDPVYVNNLEGLHRITAIRGNIEIINVQNLAHLNGLDQVTEIDGHIFLHSNDILENIDGLRNIRPETLKEVDGHLLTIQHNPLLSECALDNICQVLHQEGSTTTIFNNGPGCETEEEVLSSCIVTVPVINGVEPLQIYPNPTNGDFTVVLPDGAPGLTGSVKVYNSTGVPVLTLAYSSRVQMEGLPPGIYTLVFQAEDQQFYVARILFIP